MSKNGFLFLDLDGTIADSGTGITNALNRIFSEAGIAPLSEKEARWILGPAFQLTMPTLLENRNVDPKRSDEFIHNYRELYKSEELLRTPIIDGMREVLDELSLQFHLSVVTAKPKVQAEIAVAATNVAHHMITVVGPLESTPQPKSELLIRAMREVEDAIGVAPQLKNSYMIGDRHHDIDAATAVGTHSIGVLWGYGDREELEAAGATHVVKQPHELLQLLSI